MDVDRCARLADVVRERGEEASACAEQSEGRSNGQTRARLQRCFEAGSSLGITPTQREGEALGPER